MYPPQLVFSTLIMFIQNMTSSAFTVSPLDHFHDLRLTVTVLLSELNVGAFATLSG